MEMTAPVACYFDTNAGSVTPHVIGIFLFVVFSKKLKTVGME
jgi:hypothetical protein